MIHIFDEAVRLFFFPVRWANAVTTWIQNIASPDDSLKITNTCTPKEGRSLSLIVNMQKVCDHVKEYCKEFWVTVDRLRELLDDSCDHNSIEINDGRFRVSEKWVRENIGDRPLTLKAILNSDQSAVSELRVYLPDTTVGFGRTDYPLRIGSDTGYLTAVNGEAGWYTINGITTGTIWLVDDSIEQTVNGVVVRTPRAKFATAALGTANRLNTLVGQVIYTSGADAAVIVQTEPLRKGWLGDCEGEHDGQTAIDITLTTNANDLAIFQQEGHRLNTDTWQRGVTGLAKVTVNGDSQTLTAVQDADGNQPLCGTKIRCFTRVIRAVDIDWFVYRELEFDKNGCLRSISAEKGVHGECNYAYS